MNYFALKKRKICEKQKSDPHKNNNDRINKKDKIK